MKTSERGDDDRNDEESIEEGKEDWGRWREVWKCDPVQTIVYIA